MTQFTLEAQKQATPEKEFTITFGCPVHQG